MMRERSSRVCGLKLPVAVLMRIGLNIDSPTEDGHVNGPRVLIGIGELSMTMPIPLPDPAPGFGSQFSLQVAKMGVTLAAESDPLSDIAFVVEAMDGIVVGSIRAAIAVPTDFEGESLVHAREVLSRVPGSESQWIGRALDSERIDLWSPAQVATEVAVNAWVRRTIFRNDESRYRELFGFATVSDVRRESPLVVELAITASFVVGLLPIVIAIGVMKAVSVHRRWEAETDIRQTEADLKREQLRQARIQTKMMQHIADAIEEQADQHRLQIPEKVLSTAAKVSSPAVADLSNGSIVENVTFGISTGGRAA